jgi:hypothetical protein
VQTTRDSVAGSAVTPRFAAHRQHTDGFLLVHISLVSRHHINSTALVAQHMARLIRVAACRRAW